MRMLKVMAAALTGLALIGITGTASASADLTWPPKDVTPVHKTKAELQEQAAEFTDRQEQTFPRLFRGAQNVVHGQWGGESAGRIEDGQQYLTSWTRLTYRGQDTEVFTQVNAPGFFTDSPKQLCERDTCTGQVSDHKGGVTVFTENTQYGITIAWNFRRNGEVVWAQSWAPDTKAQVAAIAADRAYTFTR
ncbi:hypothetical protein [Lentzea albida]|uniref:Uncharacterized protein n=1 Tax=Lentzea albida TaxID=65499 RepID=A0A1H9WW73_9PSEU|nr:hypothetical protein [Lentzea albida]SES38095.1 hypothetical protein SAMN04488000_12530 [Lentzea albida]